MSEILIRRGDGTWREPLNVGYALEAELQKILAEYPELIPGVSAGAQTCREFRSGAGPADIIVVDTAGELTVVECKLAADPQIRREIIGQMFDYASALWKMDIDDFASRWRARTIVPLFPEDSNDALSLRQQVRSNLEDGRFRIVLAVDAINPELKRMVEYLNAMSGPATSIIAVAYTRLKDHETEILMPQIYGQELAETKATANTRPRTTWNLDTYRSWLASHAPSMLDKFNHFIDYATASGLSFLGSTTISPTGKFEIYDRDNTLLGTVSLITYTDDNTSIELDFYRLSRMDPQRLAAIPGLASFPTRITQIPGMEEAGQLMSAAGFANRKNTPLAELPKESIQQLIEVLTDLHTQP